MNVFKTIGELLLTVLGIIPASTVAATVNGPAIDRTGFLSCVLTGLAGAATGAPTTQSVIYKLQESVDGSTGWTDITDAAMAAITTDDTGDELDVNLAGAELFIRVVATVSFTGGTTPAQLIAATVALGGANKAPV